jgi:hypothetical protein
MRLYFGKVFVLLITFLCLGTQPVWANAGPTYWHGYPLSEILVVDENCPVEVAEEKLLLDFSQGSKGDHTVRGQVMASYQMVNPTDDRLSVQMAFPFVNSIMGFSPEDVAITVDGNPVPFDLFLGSQRVNDGYRIEPDEVSFAFGNILETLNVRDYRPEAFAPDEKGTLYTVEVSPMSEQEINFAVEFTLEQDQTKVLINGFNRYGIQGSSVRIAAWCDRQETLEIFVLGDKPDFSFRGYIDGELTEETNLFSYEIITEEVGLKSYVLRKAKERLQPWPEGLTEQLYNIYSEALDRQFANNRGFIEVYDFLSEDRRDRVMIMVYTVDFPANSERNVSVSYQGVGTMDRRETRQPVYSFQYLLNPAQHWGSFGNLEIEVITPEEAPYIIDSSIPLTQERVGYYTAKLDRLPEGDFLFSIYHKEKISPLEQVFRRLEALKYLAFFFAPFIIPVILIGIVAALIKTFAKSWKGQ